MILLLYNFPNFPLLSYYMSINLSKAKYLGKTFRLIPTQFPPIQTFADVATHDDLEAIMELEGWTNDRLVKYRLNRLPKEEWVYGCNNASIIMAAYLHAPKDGLRFNDGNLGAWYCSLEIKTAIAEVAYHLRREAHNANFAEMRSSYRTYTANLSGKYIDIRDKQEQFPELYHPDNWQKSQEFAQNARNMGEDGIFYSSIRYVKGSNIAAFKPTQINKVTISTSYELIVPKQGKIIARVLSS